MNTAKLDKVFKQVDNLSKGLPADWEEISDELTFKQYMRANHPDDSNIGHKALFSLSATKREKVFTDLRNIKKGDDTI